MIRIVYRVLVKDGQAQTFKHLAEDVLIPEARKMSGCQMFSLFQDTDAPHEFIFYEQWQDHADADAYKQRLIEILGQPHPGEEFPAKMNDLIAEDEDLI
jgi:quinol monooxygenase YgiN